MTMPVATTTQHCEAVLDEIQRVVVGKRGALTLILTTVLAGGHVLIEDLPGLGKTLIARSFAAALGLEFKRVQFTPDLLPADLLGSTVYDMQSGRFEFRAGPIFTNLLLADEINRTPPKTQAALLEAMAEGQVSIDGVTHKLPGPFVVLATDNPIEYEGTYPLPEAQLDRFAIRLELKYLSEQEEASMLRRRLDRGSAEPTVNQVVDAHDLLAMRESVEQVTVHEDVLRYVVSLATASRQHPQVAVGASPRAELDLVQLARARALLLGRDYVVPEDVKSACRSDHGAPDQPATGDVGAARARLRRRGGTAAAPAGSADQSLIHGDRNTQYASRVALAPITIDVVDRHVRRGRARGGADRSTVAAHRIRGPADRRALLDRLATADADDSCARQTRIPPVFRGRADTADGLDRRGIRRRDDRSHGQPLSMACDSRLSRR